MNILLINNLKKHLITSLEEDGASLDWTAQATSQKSKKREAVIISKSEGVFCGEILVPAVMSLVNDFNLNLEVVALKKEGSPLKSKDKVVLWKGDGESILLLERSFLNLASYMSGIATRTAALVKAANQPNCRITSTRKILPGYRDIAIYSVLSGGGYSHRVNLSGGVLIKENHIRSSGSLSKAVSKVRALAPHGLKIEVEVTNLTEVKEALKNKVEVIMLDNFSPEAVRETMKWIQQSNFKPLIEVSGGIHEGNIRSYAECGVDIISVGGLTHSVKAHDLSLLFTK